MEKKEGLSIEIYRKIRVVEKVCNIRGTPLSQLIYNVSPVNQLLLKQAVCSGKVSDNLIHPEVE